VKLPGATRLLLTGYLGGAIATYVRIGEPYPVLVPLSTSLIAWAGIYLREARLRALLPLRKGVMRSTNNCHFTQEGFTERL
jgi:hypothetical protein